MPQGIVHHLIAHVLLRLLHVLRRRRHPCLNCTAAACPSDDDRGTLPP